MLSISFYARNLEDVARIVVRLGQLSPGWVVKNDGETLTEVERDMLYMEIQDCQHRVGGEQ